MELAPQQSEKIVHRLMELDRLCFEEPVQWKREFFEEELGRPDALLMVLYPDGRIQELPEEEDGSDSYGFSGFIICRVLLQDETIDLLRIGVDPAMRRQGKGRELIESSIREAGKFMGRPMFMILEVSSTNETAMGLYGSLGFEVIHRRKGYYRDGSDALIMRKNIGHGEYT